MKDNWLLISCNPDSLCVAAELDIIESYKNDCNLYFIDLNRLVGNYHPAQGWRDWVYEKIDNKFNRFIGENMNGKDLTGSLSLMPSMLIPDLPSTINDIRKYRIGGVAVGLAALSTAASFSKTTSSSIADYGKVLKRCWRIAHKSYFIGLKILEIKLQIKRFIIFNGRHAISRPVSEVLSMLGDVSVMYYEFDVGRSGYYKFDSSVHSVDCNLRKLQSKDLDESLGCQFLESSLTRADGADSSKFSSLQVAGKIPDTLLDGRFVSFFTTSSDEYFSVYQSSALSDEFSSQFDFALQASRICKSIKSTLIIRFHPNLLSKHPSWQDEWHFDELENEGAILLLPGDDCDSYALMKKSSSVLTCGSTIGYEAAYLNIPTACAGDFIGNKIGALTDVSTLSRLEEFLINPIPEPNGKAQAIRYAAYINKPDVMLDNISKDALGNIYINGRLASVSACIRNRLSSIKDVVK